MSLSPLYILFNLDSIVILRSRYCTESHKPWKEIFTGHPAFREYTVKLKKNKRNTSNELGFLADEAFQESTYFPRKRALPEARSV